jgi:hypothetical protein
MFQTNIVEKTKTHFMFEKFFSENRAIYDMVWKDMIEPDRSQMAM